jgi:hypothetical protein
MITMRDVRVCLLYPNSIMRDEAAAALKGLQRFERYGVVCDSMQVGKNDREKVRGIKRGERILDLITSEYSVVVHADLHRETIVGSFREKEIHGLGLTASPLDERYQMGMRIMSAPRIGISMPEGSGIASVHGFRYIAKELEAIELVAAHEMGHVLGRTGHCESKGCIMEVRSSTRETGRDRDFIERFVICARGFCHTCESMIGSYINRCHASQRPT